MSLDVSSFLLTHIVKYDIHHVVNSQWVNEQHISRPLYLEIV